MKAFALRRPLGALLLVAFTPLRASGAPAPAAPPAPSASAPLPGPSVTPVPSAAPSTEAAPPPAPPPPPPPPPTAPPPKAKTKAKPLPPPKAAAPSPTAPDAKKSETAERFDRALQRFDEGDNAGALAEFKRVYELSQNPVVLYNIGLVYAAMNRPVDAVDALEPATKSGGLSASQLERATRTLADQKARIGRLMVITKPEGARVEVDSVDVAATPLKEPIRVSAGSHIVGGVAEGYAPARKEVIIAGNADATVTLELVPTQGKRLANLSVRTSLPEAEVRVDGEVVGKTPLESSITVVSGTHKVEVRRPGYAPQTRDIDLGEGSTGELSFQLAVDPMQLGTEGATLALAPDQPRVDVTVDEVHLGEYREPLRLPRGSHRIRVAAAGFMPAERDIVLEPGQVNTVQLEFVPTPETRSAYEKNASFHRTWGWIGIVGGAVIAGAGGAFLAINSSSKSDAQSELDAATQLAADDEGVCNLSGGADPAACEAFVADAQDEYDSAKNRDIIGFVGLGVGGAALITGVVLLVTGDDPSRYERKTRADGQRRTFAMTPGPGQVGAGLSLSF